MEQVLVVVYWCDLPQFELFCYSLNRFWKSNKHINIVISTKVHKDKGKNITRVGVARIKNKVKNIVKTYLNQWNYTIKIGEKNLLAGGWDEQQIYKIIESANSTTVETVVFDCKDVLLDDLKVNDFKDENNHYLIKTITDAKKHNQSRNEVFSPIEYWNVDSNTLPENLTPWIWNNRDVKDFMKELERREGKKLLEIEFFPGIYEIESFYIFIKEVFKLPRSQYSPMKGKKAEMFYDFTPLDANINVYGMKKVKILKIHRNNVNRQFFIDNTIEILQYYNFPDSLIENWKIGITDYLENWKTHSDLKFDPYENVTKK